MCYGISWTLQYKGLSYVVFLCIMGRTFALGKARRDEIKNVSETVVLDSKHIDYWEFGSTPKMNHIRI